MALTRKFLKALKLDEDIIEQIIDAHSETVEGLTKYKEDAEKLPGVQKELETLKAQGDGGWKQKYEDEHAAHEKLKSDQASRETRSAKEKAYRSALKEAGVDEKRHDSILRVTDLDSVELETDGKLKGADEHKKAITSAWADFIPTTTTTGADTSTPPAGSGSQDYSDMSDADYYRNVKKI